MVWYSFDRAANDFHGITPDVPDEAVPAFFALDDFEPEALRRWRAPRVSISNDRARKRGDFPGFTRLPPVFSARALDALRPLLSSCDILPLDCRDEPLVAVSPPKLTQSLDHQASEADEWLEDGRFIHMKRWVFRGPRIPKEPIFRLEEERGFVIVSDAFREAVEKHGLKGASFEALDAIWKP